MRQNYNSKNAIHYYSFGLNYNSKVIIYYSSFAVNTNSKRRVSYLLLAVKENSKHSVHAPARFILLVSKTRCPVLSLPLFHYLYYSIWCAVRSNKKPLFKRKISWIYRKFTEKEKVSQNCQIFLFLPVTQIYIDI